jgi:sn-glycerol 3-phosphate transport system permease protein
MVLALIVALPFHHSSLWHATAQDIAGGPCCWNAPVGVGKAALFGREASRFEWPVAHMMWVSFQTAMVIALGKISILLSAFAIVLACSAKPVSGEDFS